MGGRNGVSTLSIFRGLLGLEQTAIENVRLDPVGSLVIEVRPMAGAASPVRSVSPAVSAL